jgi:DNA-binding IclR family transcriptional regulator
VPVGAVMPLSRGSAGKVLLAFAPGGVDAGPDAPELRGIRVRGWAQSVAEREAGVASVSAPVFGEDGRLRAAVSISGPISRLTESPGQRLSHLVVEAAREIEGATNP